MIESLNNLCRQLLARAEAGASREGGVRVSSRHLLAPLAELRDIKLLLIACGVNLKKLPPAFSEVKAADNTARQYLPELEQVLTKAGEAAKDGEVLPQHLLLGILQVRGSQGGKQLSTAGIKRPDELIALTFASLGGRSGDTLVSVSLPFKNWMAILESLYLSNAKTGDPNVKAALEAIKDSCIESVKASTAPS